MIKFFYHRVKFFSKLRPKSSGTHQPFPIINQSILATDSVQTASCIRFESATLAGCKMALSSGLRNFHILRAEPPVSFKHNRPITQRSEDALLTEYRSLGPCVYRKANAAVWVLLPELDSEGQFRHSHTLQLRPSMMHC
jgi:hypothetical protein